jgi:hypothetical protein
MFGFDLEALGQSIGNSIQSLGGSVEDVSKYAEEMSRNLMDLDAIHNDASRNPPHESPILPLATDDQVDVSSSSSPTDIRKYDVWDTSVTIFSSLPLSAMSALTDVINTATTQITPTFTEDVDMNSSEVSVSSNKILETAAMKGVMENVAESDSNDSEAWTELMEFEVSVSSMNENTSLESSRRETANVNTSQALVPEKKLSAIPAATINESIHHAPSIIFKTVSTLASSHSETKQLAGNEISTGNILNTPVKLLSPGGVSSVTSMAKSVKSESEQIQEKVSNTKKETIDAQVKGAKIIKNNSSNNDSFNSPVSSTRTKISTKTISDSLPKSRPSLSIDVDSLSQETTDMTLVPALSSNSESSVQKPIGVVNKIPDNVEPSTNSVQSLLEGVDLWRNGSEILKRLQSTSTPTTISGTTSRVESTLSLLTSFASPPRLVEQQHSVFDILSEEEETRLANDPIQVLHSGGTLPLSSLPIPLPHFTPRVYSEGNDDVEYGLYTNKKDDALVNRKVLSC